MSSGKRYKFNGSSFAVQIGEGAPKTVTGATAANPVVISAAAHGFPLGGVARLANIDAPPELDGGVYAVDNPASGTFELAGVDGTGWAVFDAGTPAAQAFPAVFSDFCELTGMNQQGGGADQIEVSTICSTKKEFEQGLGDSGTLQLDFNLAPLEEVQTALREAEISGDQIAFRVVLPDPGGQCVMIGTVQSTSFQGTVNGVWTGSATIKLSGEIFWLENT
jgi:hypothetical protein